MKHNKHLMQVSFLASLIIILQKHTESEFRLKVKFLVIINKKIVNSKILLNFVRSKKIIHNDLINIFLNSLINKNANATTTAPSRNTDTLLPNLFIPTFFHSLHTLTNF